MTNVPLVFVLIYGAIIVQSCLIVATKIAEEIIFSTRQNNQRTLTIVTAIQIENS